MSLVINHNLMAMTVARNLGDIYSRLGSSTQRLSSGLRVNSAADDAAGLAIRELMRADIAVLNQGIRNAGDAISMIQTAEGAMSVIDEKLIRMKELAEQSATGTYTTAQREIMNSEFQAMAAEIDRIANATDFNGVKLLNGTLSYQHEGSGLKIHFGTGNDEAEDYYYLNIADMRATEATGLRVGNADPRDTVRTTSLNAASDTAKLEASASNTDGYFGIRWSSDYDNEVSTTGNATWSVYGYVSVDASQDSVSSLAAEINKGRQAWQRVEVNDATYTSASANLTINGQIFTFSSNASSYDAAAGTGVIQVTSSEAASSSTSIALAVQDYINTHSTSIGVVATGYGNDDLYLFAREWGEAGNSINVASATTAFEPDAATLQDGGQKVVTAAVYYDEGNEEYELQLQMNQGGERNQVQVFNFTTTSAGVGNLGTNIVGGFLTGTTVNNTWIPTQGGLADYASADETDEWITAQEGSGRTLWDGADILTQSAAQRSLGALDDAIEKKDTGRAQLGSIQNRLENTITNLTIQAEMLQAAESRISDVDVATEMTEFTRNNILAQAAVAMLAQANSLPMLALSLLG
jgi:flagellin